MILLILFYLCSLGSKIVRDNIKRVTVFLYISVIYEYFYFLLF